MARAWAQGGGEPYPVCKQTKKKQDRVAANLERTGFGAGMGIAGGKSAPLLKAGKKKKDRRRTGIGIGMGIEGTKPAPLFTQE